ncbi:3-keto-L-gulonate-6-phosphate decarboxylase [Corynebacterium phocae]|uniref:3-keto-L-gulonate-6-phosphate decarboxylase n=1 Tax=Corynebacterium phocae TaxID=161895 RepID=A0A1L7D1K7_9CORY|nr:3-dehydro-L-gulonate-6-phosphate decarboxylase [Corynebacterium phocae]APT91984.1 3-keto-L-gulonate-6-phosphate decarboxylase [Corynebacterium phocae]KAA8726980.1 3-keto-L-gulonate-6-phosphate decarboxylase [Corynebacterium phocae]
MTRLQIALDTASISEALRPLNKAIDAVDVIECGTILILHEGLRAVEEIRALYPEKTILADVRIAEAGQIIAKACFSAGADWVSCVAGASLTTIEQVVEVAREFGGEVQVELNDDHYTLEKAKKWRELGVEHVIVKRSRDQEAAGILEWGKDDLQRISDLHELGFTVSVTGGIKPAELDTFADSAVDVVIAGRSILKADDPRAAADAFQQAFDRVWP